MQSLHARPPLMDAQASSPAAVVVSDDAMLFAGPLTLPAPQRDAIRAAYAQPQRAYHHLGHVAEVLAQLRLVDAGPGWAQPKEVWLAAVYHDAIYVPGRKDNEARSAALAAEHIARWLPAGVDADRVSQLILLTARHGRLRPQDLDADAYPDDARLFLDCDMAILAADPARFAAYDREIAEEYRGRVPGFLYRRGRRAFFRGLCDAERIYLSDFFHSRCDAAARANLRAALAGTRT